MSFPSLVLRPLTLLSLMLMGGAVTSPAARADSWALLIGIDQYADANRITSLGGASADARSLGKTLHEVALVPSDHIQLLVSDGENGGIRPTRTEILNALTRLAANAKPGDTVFVFYGGHGIEIDGTPYLLPYDTSALSDADITDTALETEKFTKRLRQINARALVLAFDMCRSDPRKGKRSVEGTSADNTLSQSQVRGLDFARASTAASGSAAGGGAPVTITFYSCSPNERSYEDRYQARGYFSEFLEKGLRGEAVDDTGTVRVGNLAKYLEKKVHAAVSQSENGASQTPYPELKGPGAEEFALSYIPPDTGTGHFTKATVVNTKARLRISVNAPNPTITIEGQPLAAGTDYVLNLTEEETKTVRVKVAASGYDTQILDVPMKRGITSPLAVTLEASTPPAPAGPDLGKLPSGTDSGSSHSRLDQLKLDIPAELRFDGVYQASQEKTVGDDHQYYMYLRFYADKKVISATTFGSPTDVEKWLNLQRYSTAMDHPDLYTREKTFLTFPYGTASVKAIVTKTGLLATMTLANGKVQLYTFRFVPLQNLK